MLNTKLKIILLISTLTIASGCTPAHEKLSQKLDLVTQGGDKSKVISYLDKLDKSKITDDEGKLLRQAIDIEDITIVEKLLLQENIKINAKGSDSYTPLAYLIVNSDRNDKKRIDIASLLITSGANVNSVATKGETLLILSADHNLPEITKLLIDNGADINAQAANGETALHRAKESTLRILLENNADVKILDNQGNTVLHHLYYSDDIALVLSKGVDINAKNNKGETILFNACQKICNDSRIEQLLKNGADPNIQNNDSVAVIHLATKTLSVPAIKLLIDNNADIKLTGKDSRTSLHYLALSLKDADYSDNTKLKQVYEIAALLIASGADPLAKDSNGKDPFDLASGIIKPKIDKLKADAVKSATSYERSQ